MVRGLFPFRELTGSVVQARLARQELRRLRRFEQACLDISVPMHRSPKHHGVASQLVKQHVLSERSRHHQESPVAETWMSKSAARSELWVLAEKLAGYLNR
jgi:hypothetical protein